MTQHDSILESWNGPPDLECGKVSSSTINSTWSLSSAASALESLLLNRIRQTRGPGVSFLARLILPACAIEENGMCVMFIIRKSISHNRTPIGSPFSGLGKKGGQWAREGERRRNQETCNYRLVFLLIPEPKWYGTMMLWKMLWWARKWECWCWRPVKGGKFVKLYSITATYLIHEPLMSREQRIC